MGVSSVQKVFPARRRGVPHVLLPSSSSSSDDSSFTVYPSHIHVRYPPGKMTKRMRRSSARGDGKNMRHLKMRSEGPSYDGGGVWVMKYTFEMMLMKIKVREEFIMDEQGKIKELTRIRM